MSDGCQSDQAWVGRMSTNGWRCLGFWIGMASGVWGVNYTKSMSGQEMSASIEGRHGRIVYPLSGELPLAQLHKTVRVLDDLMDDPAVAGFPADASIGKPITVSLATVARRSDVDGWSYPLRRLVVLPAGKWKSWDPVRLRRVLRHEIAHVRMGIYLEERRLPRWFEEGLAEWVSGGLTCEGRFRLWIEVQRRDANGGRLRSLSGESEVMPIRLEYDFHASFFEFLEKVKPGLVSDGDLVAEVRQRGVDDALLRTLGWSHGRTEGLWWQYLRERFREAPSDSGCLVS